MIQVHKAIIPCFCLAALAISLQASEQRQEGESKEAYEARAQKCEAERTEPLSLSDNAYIKIYGYKSFYDSTRYYVLSPAQKKTFLEEWMQYGIKNNLIDDMCQARKNAVNSNIMINSQLLEQAAEVIARDMHEAMIFLTKVLPHDRVHEITKDLEALSKKH